jgi:hypothetical protein
MHSICLAVLTALVDMKLCTGQETKMHQSKSLSNGHTHKEWQTSYLVISILSIQGSVSFFCEALEM